MKVKRRGWIEHCVSVRRDLNDCVRDESGKVSPVKIGLLVGQIIAAYLLLHHSEYVIDRWDALAIMLIALTAPDLLKKIIAMKYGANGVKTK